MSRVKFSTLSNSHIRVNVVTQRICNHLKSKSTTSAIGSEVTLKRQQNITALINPFVLTLVIHLRANFERDTIQFADYYSANGRCS